MKTLISVYGINALAFLSNLAAVFVFLALAGPAGYGSYGIYIVFLAVYYLWDISLIKTTLVVHDEAQRRGDPDPAAHAVSFLRGSLLVFAAGSLVLIASGDLIYPVDPATGIGGMVVMLIVACEHLLSYPANRVIFHLTLEKRFRTIYTLRLAATLLRHAASWGVLLLTGSVLWAIVAILLKGLVVGAVSLYWIADRFPTARRPALQLARGDLAIVLSFFAAAVVVVVMQELPSLFIDRTYGREALGAYRMLYDIVAAVWFLATIYPTILFSSLLAGKAQRTPEETTAFLVRVGDRLALFHLAYFLGVCALILIERSFLWGRLEAAPYAFGVVAGVSILGYSRFLVEVAQAHGQGRLVLGATLATAGCVALVFALWPAETGLTEIGWAWLIGQALFFALLKIILSASLAPDGRVFRDAAILVLPAALVVVAEYAAPTAGVLLPICVAGAAASLVALLVLMRRASAT